MCAIAVAQVVTLTMGSEVSGEVAQAGVADASATENNNAYAGYRAAGLALMVDESPQRDCVEEVLRCTRGGSERPAYAATAWTNQHQRIRQTWLRSQSDAGRYRFTQAREKG